MKREVTSEWREGDEKATRFLVEFFAEKIRKEKEELEGHLVRL